MEKALILYFRFVMACRWLGGEPRILQAASSFQASGLPMKFLRATANQIAKMPTSLSRVFAILVLASGFVGHGACAEWPERAITIIVPFAPGGHTDILGRLLAAQLGSRLGQSVVVENRVSKDGKFDLSAAGRAASHGYTLLVTSNAALINLSMSRLVYDPLKDFEPIAYLGAAPNVIVTRPTSGIDSIASLIAKAKAEPGKLTDASPGVGTSSQLTVELLKQHAMINIRHIPFTGSDMALTAALSGATDIAALSTTGLINYIQTGELKALVQTGKNRWDELPDVPTMVEIGVPDAVLMTSVVFLAPARTPSMIIDKLARQVRAILAQPEIISELRATGFIVDYEGPDELRARLSREIPTWKKLVERAGLAD
jgi:tripartite-type tricarboxylate transporter receptor subunit TctC